MHSRLAARLACSLVPVLLFAQPPKKKKITRAALRDYEIDDAATKRGLLATLVALDILEGHDDAARGPLDEIKALEEKPAAKALRGFILRSILDVRRESADRNSPAYRKAV